jgi:hypothetical protein
MNGAVLACVLELARRDCDQLLVVTSLCLHWQPRKRVMSHQNVKWLSTYKQRSDQRRPECARTNVLRLNMDNMRGF